MSDENVGGLVLLPCPGCGGDRTRIIGGPGTKGGPKFWAGCDLCRWRTWGNTEEDAILSWNTRVSAHGQPVDYSPALHSVLSYIAYGECDEEGLHPGLFATVKEKIDKLRSKPVVDEAMEERAIKAFWPAWNEKRLRGDYRQPGAFALGMRAALTAAITGATP